VRNAISGLVAVLSVSLGTGVRHLAGGEAKPADRSIDTRLPSVASGCSVQLNGRNLLLLLVFVNQTM
jgi:hypothetical protein